MSSYHAARSAINAALSRVYPPPVTKKVVVDPVVVADSQVLDAVPGEPEAAPLVTPEPPVSAEPSASVAVEPVTEPAAAAPVLDAVVEPVVVEPPAVLEAVSEPAAVAPVAVEPAPASVEPVVVNPANGTLDSADGDDDPSAVFAATTIAVAAAATIQEWVETDPALLEDGESLADRLLMMFVGIADQDQNGELDEDETAVLVSALDYGWDYLASKGVSEEDCSSLLNDWDETVAMRVRDLVASTLPEGDEAAADEIDDFVFGDDDQGAVFDAVYKKRLVIRDGKKVRINKRVSGTIRLTSAQKVGIRKAQMKSHNATATMRRAKSLRKAKAMGLGAK